MNPLVAFSLGATGWSALEYGLHRFAMHEMRGRGLASREHLHHHADVTYFSPTSKKLLSAAATAAVVFPASWAVVGAGPALAITAGMNAAYGAYEITHRRIHTHAPRNAYGRWMRRSHLHHHFGAPMHNLGVTSPVWDVLFRTYDDPGVVTVPRRLAPVWLLDDAGEVRAEYADDYRARGRRAGEPAVVARDQADALANRPPQLDDSPDVLVAAS